MTCPRRKKIINDMFWCKAITISLFVNTIKVLNFLKKLALIEIIALLKSFLEKVCKLLKRMFTLDISNHLHDTKSSLEIYSYSAGYRLVDFKRPEGSLPYSKKNHKIEPDLEVIGSFSAKIKFIVLHLRGKLFSGYACSIPNEFLPCVLHDHRFIILVLIFTTK